MLRLVIGAVGAEVVPVELGTILMIKVLDTPLTVAVSKAICLIGIPVVVPVTTEFPPLDVGLALMEKMISLAPECTVTDGAGMDRSALLLDSETVVPLAGAALLSVAVHVEVAPRAKVVGLHVSELRVCVDTKLIAEVCETPLRAAVSVAL
jgi:hypothetical protein